MRTIHAARLLSLGFLLSGMLLAQDNKSSPTGTEQPQATDRAADTARANSPGDMVVPEGAQVTVRTNEAIDSTTTNQGQSYSGTLQEPVTGADGQILIPKGSDAQLTIRQMTSNGTTGSPQLVLGLESIDIHGHHYVVNSADLSQSNDRGIGKNRRTAKYIGGGAALGTLLGAIAGGGKGAAIGAVAGAVAGGATQVLTKGKEVRVPAETTLTFRLDQPLTLKTSD
jgi:hypothetical protein